MHEIDASFRRKLSDAREKQQRLLRRRIFGAAAACLVLAVAAASYFVFEEHAGPRNRVAGDVTNPEPEAPKDTPFVANAIIDLAGDPLIIRLGSSAERNTRLKDFDVPDEMKQPAVPDSLQVLSDTMLSSSVRIMALPSSPEDFAFFQAQSARVNPLPRRDAAVDDEARPAAPEEENYEGADEVLVPVAGQDDLEGDAAAPAEEDAAPPTGATLPAARSRRHRRDRRCRRRCRGWLGRDGRARPGGPALVQGDRDRRHDHRADRHARDRQVSGYRGPDFLGQGRAAAGDQHHRIRLHRGRRQEGRRSRKDTAWAERARRPLRRADCAATGQIRSRPVTSLCSCRSTRPTNTSARSR